MYTYSLTKHDPKDLDENGWYAKDEWTEIDDVGQVFEGKIFIFDEYIKYENAYIHAIMTAMKANKLTYLRIKNLEKERHRYSYHDMSKRKVSDYVKILREKQKVSMAEVGFLASIILRGMVWCKMYYENDMYVHFLTDFYMYIGSRADISKELKTLEKEGVFTEDFVSPCLNDYERRYYFKDDLGK